MPIYRHRSTARMLALLCSTALAGTLLPIVAPMTPAIAQSLYGATGGQTQNDSGKGGDAGQVGVDATGANAGSGGSAGTAADHDGGKGGSGDAGGGGGGGYSNIVSGDISADMTGGNGGDGGDGAIHGGGGGAGDGARNADAAPEIHVSATVQGGNGGNAAYPGGSGGGGGAGLVLQHAGTVTIESGVAAAGGNGGNPLLFGGGGGAGVVLNEGGTLVNHGQIQGGGGGHLSTSGTAVVMGGSANVTNDGHITGGTGGDFSPAGEGIDLRNGGSVINSGLITGGDGHGGSGDSTGLVDTEGGTGSGGASGYIPYSRTIGAAAAGIVGANVSVINAGTIAGGRGFFSRPDGRVNAITFTGGDNRLEIQGASKVIGNAVVESGATGTLALGGDSDPSDPFDVSKIVATAAIDAADEYVGFSAFEKTGASTWTLTGTGAQDWLINNGTLVGDTNSFGGDLTFGSGAGTRGVVFNQPIDGTYSGTISGEGTFSKIGGGTLTLTGEGNQVSLFTVHNGMLAVDDGTLDQPIYVSGGENYVGANAGDDAALVITNGGKVSTANSFLIGNSAGSQGSAIVTGDGSSLNVVGGFAGLTVGFGGEGALSIMDGGHVSAPSFLNVGGGNWGQLGDGFLSIDGLGSSAETGTLTIAGYGDGSAGTVTVSDGGVLNAQATIWMGLNNPTGAATLNIGAGSTDPADAAAPGILQAPGIDFLADSASLNFNHTGTAYVFDTPLASANTGAGFINHYAGSTILTGDSSGFSGDTTVHGGTLKVNGTLGGRLDVMSGGRLQGTGTVGATTIASGGTIAPGNSIGTLTVDGDYAQLAGSTYVAEIEPGGTSDLIDVKGKAAIEGGTVFALKAPGGYGAGSRYTILTADGGVTGMYGTLDQNAPFVDLALAYDPDNVYLDVARNDVAFCDVAGTFNQCSTGDGAESLDAGDPVYDAIAGVPDAETARYALDQLSGEIHASAKSALIEDSHFVREAVNDRIRSAFGDAVGTDMPLLAYGPDGSRPVSSDRSAPVAWGRAFGSWGSFDGDGNAAAMDTSTGGFLTGIDGEIASNIRLGLLAGYSHSSFEVDDRASSGNSDNYHLGLYAGGRWDAIRLSGGLAYTWHDIETSRSVVFPGFSDQLSADYNAGTFQAFGEAGYRIEAGAVSFEPFANLAYVSLHTDGFAEQGGGAAIHVRGETTDTTFTMLGIHLSSAFDLGGMKAAAHGTLGWRHAFGDTTPISTHAFAAGGPFAIAGVPIAEDAGIIEAGLDLNLTPNATLGIAYQGQMANDARQHGFNAKLEVRF